MAKEKDKDGAEKESADPAAARTPKIVLPPPARFEIRTPIEQFTGKRGGGNFWNKKIGKLESHEGVSIKNGLGWTDDELVANECVRFGYKVTDHTCGGQKGR
jgi:hypothetical protein